MKRKELIVLAVILGLVNVPLVFGDFAEGLVYFPEKLLTGQWWSIVTHPFVHVSGYHLLLDGAAFLLLYAQLQEKRFTRRMLHLLGIHASVVLGVTLSLPYVRASGYCGLSGLAHGLMALWCMERIGWNSADRTERLLAAGIGTGLLAKSIYEAAAGHVFFESMHLGSVGVPVVISHIAGVIGALITYGLLNILQVKSYCKSTKRTLVHNI